MQATDEKVRPQDPVEAALNRLYQLQLYLSDLARYHEQTADAVIQWHRWLADDVKLLREHHAGPPSTFPLFSITPNNRHDSFLTDGMWLSAVQMAQAADLGRVGYFPNITQHHLDPEDELQLREDLLEAKLAQLLEPVHITVAGATITLEPDGFVLDFEHIYTEIGVAGPKHPLHRRAMRVIRRALDYVHEHAPGKLVTRWGMLPNTGMIDVDKPLGATVAEWYERVAAQSLVWEACDFVLGNVYVRTCEDLDTQTGQYRYELLAKCKRDMCYRLEQDGILPPDAPYVIVVFGRDKRTWRAFNDQHATQYAQLVLDSADHVMLWGCDRTKFAQAKGVTSDPGQLADEQTTMITPLVQGLHEAHHGGG